MSRGLLVLTCNQELTDMVNYVSQRYELAATDVVSAAIAMLVGQLNAQDARVLKYMSMVSDNAKREHDLLAGVR